MKIEIRTKALRAGKWVDGVWEPAGQLLAELEIADGHPMLTQIMVRLERGAGDDDEPWEVTII